MRWINACVFIAAVFAGACSESPVAPVDSSSSLCQGDLTGLVGRWERVLEGRDRHAYLNRLDIAEKGDCEFSYRYESWQYHAGEEEEDLLAYASEGTFFALNGRNIGDLLMFDTESRRTFQVKLSEESEWERNEETSLHESSEGKLWGDNLYFWRLDFIRKE